MADSKKYNGSTWGHSLRKLTTATDIITSLPADLYADGNNATVGISGNMEQSGTPTLTTPIQPQETGERTENLFDMSFYEGKSGITVSGNKATGTCDRFFNVKLSIPPELYGQELTWSVYFKRPDNPNTLRLQTADNGSYKYGNNIAGEGRSTVSFTATSTIKLYVNYANTGSDTIELSDITLNLGSTPLPYEPYGYKIPISSANTTTNIYLGEVETTRKIYKWVLTGNEEGWLYTNGFVYNQSITPDYLRSAAQTVVCSHFKAIPNVTAGGNVGEGECALYSAVGVQRLYFRDSNYITSVSDFKTYLQQQYAAGTPVTVWYVLATEETGIVNEPLRKIGDYADTVSGITVPTITGKDTFDVETSLKPSAVSLNYTGWHDATVKEWDGSQWD